jgi:hypothetical protein
MMRNRVQLRTTSHMVSVVLAHAIGTREGYAGRSLELKDNDVLFWLEFVQVDHEWKVELHTPFELLLFVAFAHRCFNLASPSAEKSFGISTSAPPATMNPAVKRFDKSSYLGPPVLSSTYRSSWRVLRCVKLNRFSWLRMELEKCSKWRE